MSSMKTGKCFKRNLDSRSKIYTFQKYMNTHLSMKSGNEKVGRIPVSTTAADSCPPSCPFRFNGCYAQTGPIDWHWKRVSKGIRGDSYDVFLKKIENLPEGQLWRHNQAGDLYGKGDAIDPSAFSQLVTANQGKRGFTYTHKPVEGQAGRLNAVMIKSANRNGFTVSLSANNPTHADDLADLKIGPVVTVLPESQATNTVTPKGRKIMICPAITKEYVSCSTCQLCQKARRSVIVGFPSHGTRKKTASKIASR